MITLSGVRSVLGAVELVFPTVTGQLLYRVRLTPRERMVVRVLGGRQLLQAAGTAFIGGPDIHRVGACVDGLHALSMLGLAVATRRLRRAGSCEFAIATSLAAASLVVAHHTSRGVKP